MGEIAEMMLDGTLCELCGVYMGSSPGYPQRCPSCHPHRPVQTAPVKAGQLKYPCPICHKRVKLIGLSDHVRDAHER